MQARGNFDQHVVTHFMALHVVDVFEVVEVEYQKRDFPVQRFRPGDHVGCAFGNGTAVETFGERVGTGERVGNFFRFAPVYHFRGKLPVPAPAEQYQRDVEQHGGGNDRIRTVVTGVQ